jgi:hypothetical protein
MAHAGQAASMPASNNAGATKRRIRFLRFNRAVPRASMNSRDTKSVPDFREAVNFIFQIS